MSKKKREYKQSYDGDYQYPTLRRPSFVSCCDCGLVHKHIITITPDDFLIRDGRTKKWRRGRRVRIKVSRDQRKTASNRREMFRRKELFKTKDGWYIVAVPVSRKEWEKQQRKSRK
jgi:hypothetical protein